MRTLLLILFCQCCFASGLRACCDTLSPPSHSGKKPKKTKAVYDTDFQDFLDETIRPKLPIITCEHLRYLLDNDYDMYILDTRSREAYSVSHIVGARWVGYDDFSQERVWALDRGRPVVIYGYSGDQSERIGRRLVDLGFADVSNLYVGIFEWMYEGGVVVDAEEQPTYRVQLLQQDRLRFLRR